jgi:hypothetical protein
MNNGKKAAGLIYGPEAHHLDHLAIVCHIMQIPLVVTEEDLADLARKYYPRLEIIHADYLQVAEQLVQNFEIIFYCMPRVLFDEILFFAQQLHRKRLHTIWCPHGNSDKGHATPFMEALDKEEVALVYGKKMVEFLMRKHVFEQLKAHVLTGNFRYAFYKTHRDFYAPLVRTEITQRLPKADKTLLFAPTWQDQENSSSFFEACPLLIEKLPENHNLIIKLHPNLRLQEEIKVERILEKYEERPNVLFLTEFPPIYPLLDLVDIYIGDMSSIGYDFLTFDKPMFFLNQSRRDAQNDPGLYLYRCGTEILPDRYPEIYEIIAKTDDERFSAIRKEVYTYTFAPEKNPDTLREEILKTYVHLTKDDLDFL